MVAVTGTVYDNTGTAVAGRVVRAYRRADGALLGETASGDGAVAQGDPYWANVALLLRFAGPDGSAVFMDDGPLKLTHTIAPGNGPTISVAASKWNTSSGRFTGATAGYLGVAANTGVDLRTGDFTVECFVRFDGLGLTRRFLLQQGGSTGNYVFSMETTTTNKFSASSCDTLGNVSYLVSTASFVANTWYHVAYVRAGTNFHLYVNGVRVATTTQTGDRWASTPDAVTYVGAYLNLYSTFGYINSVRITKGVARYTGTTFTVPTAEFPAYTAAVMPLGQYSINLGGVTGEVNVVALDNVAGTVENDLIIRTTGV